MWVALVIIAVAIAIAGIVYLVVITSAGPKD